MLLHQGRDRRPGPQLGFSHGAERVPTILEGESLKSPTKKDNRRRVPRGGSWFVMSTSVVRAAYLDFITPTIRDSDIGFRCAQRGVRMPLEGHDTTVKTLKVDNLRREILGGQSAHWVATYVRPAFRSSNPPSYRSPGQGFRTRLQLRERIVPATPAKWEK